MLVFTCKFFSTYVKVGALTPHHCIYKGLGGFDLFFSSPLSVLFIVVLRINYKYFFYKILILIKILYVNILHFIF